MIRNIFRRRPKPEPAVEPVATGDIAAAHALLNRSLRHETTIEQWDVSPYRDALLFRDGAARRYLVLGVTIIHLHPNDDIEHSYGVIADAEALSADWNAVSGDLRDAMGAS